MGFSRDLRRLLGERRKALNSRLAAFYWNVRRSWEAGFFLDPPTHGMLRGLWDYYRQRFGDCPPAIRHLDAAYRKRAYIPLLRRAQRRWEDIAIVAAVRR